MATGNVQQIPICSQLIHNQEPRNIHRRITVKITFLHRAMLRKTRESCYQNLLHYTVIIRKIWSYYIESKPCGRANTIALLLKASCHEFRFKKSTDNWSTTNAIHLCWEDIKRVIPQRNTAIGENPARRALSAPCISIFQYKLKPASNKMVRWLPAGWIFAFLVFGTFTEASHFRHGSIMWAPDDSNSNTVQSLVTLSKQFQTTLGKWSSIY